MEVNIDMSKKAEEKRTRGRPRKVGALTTRLPVMVSVEIMESIDAWMAESGVESRHVAARMLIEEGLSRSGKRITPKGKRVERGLVGEPMPSFASRIEPEGPKPRRKRSPK
jgi:hypothetical protein